MYEIVYHGEVVSKDLPKIDRHWKGLIRIAIEAKLATKPQVYGKPLRSSLKNYRKLRVGDYRVIFRMEANMVKIFAILHRSKVYKNNQRLN
jgi:mRNA interferase RelE/StbE